MNKPTDSSEVVIRPTLSADTIHIARIYNHYVDAGEATFDRVHWSEAHVIGLLDSGHPDGHYVATVNESILGWASARRFSDRHGYRLSCETAIYLDPAAVGKSIGDPLQRQIDEHCQEHGFHHATAKIIADNQRSMSFHYRHGYTLVGIQKEIGHVNGNWADVAILQKLFA